MNTDTTETMGRPRKAIPADFDKTLPAKDLAKKHKASLPVVYRWLEECGVNLKQGPPRWQPPADFDPSLGIAAARAKYGVCEKTLRRWKAQTPARP